MRRETIRECEISIFHIQLKKKTVRVATCMHAIASVFFAHFYVNMARPIN